MSVETTGTGPVERAAEDREYLVREADLLILNAVFEAARAGASGTGLAVAAEEAKHTRPGPAESGPK